jgi:diamine N-acetyltransferase
VTHAPIPEVIPVCGDEQITVVVQLARQIWSEHYLNIIGQAQIDYMLERFQSCAAIAAQLREGDEYFLLQHDGQHVGYAAIRADGDSKRLFVSKLYLLDTVRGRGLGRASMQYLAQLAHTRGLRTLWLTVNKNNPALQSYLKIGFVKTADVVTDIGGGYVMDDFQLEWTPTYPETGSNTQ